MKPTLDNIYDKYVKKVQQVQKAEQEASIANQTNQWQSQQQQPSLSSQRRPLETSDVSTEWNLQDALKGVAGVGYNEGSKYKRTRYH